ncbi:MAG: HDIG domain-containing protein [Desulfobacteraceae bacterium]|nr:MAG: HDIG domain-containing protein [Desulfobacteraceae bacterium]
MSVDLKKKIPLALATQARLKWLMLVALVAVFLFLLYPGMVVRQHRYELGDIARRDIKASHDFLLEDTAATAANQQQVSEQVLTVYDHDPRIAPQLTDRIRTVFGKMHRIMVNLQMPAQGATDANAPNAGADRPNAADAIDQQEIEKALWAQKEAFETSLGIEISRGAYRLLISESFSSAISETIIKIIEAILSNGVVANKEVLLKEADRGITLRDVSTQTERTVFSLRPYYGPDQAKTMVRIVAEPLVKDLNYNLINLIVDLSQRLVHPNITLNHNETEERKKQALNEIKPILYKIKAGEMLLREGERVTAEQLLKLRALAMQNKDRGVSTSGIGAAILLSTLLIVFYVLYFRQPRYIRVGSNKNLLFLTLVLTATLLMSKIGVTLSAAQLPSASFSVPGETIIFAVPVAAGAMLVCLVLGFEIALPFSLVAGVCAGLVFGGRIEIFLFLVISNAMAAFWVQHCRERRVVILAGFKVGLLNILLALGITIYTSEYGRMALVWNGLTAFTGGFTSGIIALGVAPLVEMAFRYTTDITLLELSNQDRPILRQLMIEVPGTYHHSVIVGSMVEAAAAEIGANPLLAKVCGYYHDIGKIKKPLYFIENQTDGRNKHDKLAPSMSSLILTSHVKDGVELAQKNALGQIIIDTIQQHHGTSLIHYFYEKAKQLKGEDAVKIEDYRYPGPKPQTKEIGLVMLADVVEAASRSLENPTAARIRGLVQHLINKVFSDGQLDNCELTLKDLHSIAKSFNTILNGIHHHRIEYADGTSKENAKVKNGNPDRQSAPKPPSRDPIRAKESPGHLKRLGMS